VRLKTATGGYLRPVQMLYPLEVGDDEEMLKSLKNEPDDVFLPSVMGVPDASTCPFQAQTKSERLVKFPKCCEEC
jgi:hypothetical protein